MCARDTDVGALKASDTLRAFSECLPAYPWSRGRGRSLTGTGWPRRVRWAGARSR